MMYRGAVLRCDGEKVMSRWTFRLPQTHRLACQAERSEDFELPARVSLRWFGDLNRGWMLALTRPGRCTS